MPLKLPHNYDLQVPQALLTLQKWFGQMIFKPLDKSGNAAPFSKRAKKLIHKYVAPSQVLDAEKRLEIYNQQIWWRFLTSLQEVFPTLCALFGYHNFNETFAIPYLKKHRPSHWSLGKMGKLLPQWIEKYYHAKDKELILSAAQIDWAFWETFLTPKKSPLQYSSEEIDKLLNSAVFLQPHLKLFDLSFNLFSLREKLLKKGVAHWQKNNFPHLEREKPRYYFLMYRNALGRTCVEEILEGEWHLLNAINTGQTINEACTYLENLGGNGYTQAKAELAIWLKKWIVRKYLLNLSE